MSETPQNPEQLRDEIQQTRADLGTTVQALAEKTDVKTRAQKAISDTTDRAKVKLQQAATTAKDRLATSTSTATDTVKPAKQRLAAAKQQVADVSRRPQVRQAVTPAAIAAGIAALIAVGILLARRRA